jgi:hypothetical protein
MTPERRLLVHDLLVGASPFVVFGYLLSESGLGTWAVWPTLFAALLVAGGRYVEEHEAHPPWVAALGENPFAVAGVGLGVALVLGVPLVFVEWIRAWYIAAVLGAGVGFVGYRLLFGVVLPAPERAVEAIREASG